MASRMRVVSSERVFEHADKVVQVIVDTYFEPNKTLDDLHAALPTHRLTYYDPLAKPVAKI